MTSLTTIRSARRLTSAITLISLAACSEQSLTGTSDAPLLSRGKNASAQPAASAEVRVEIALAAPAVDAPFTAAKGKAKFKSKGTERQLEIEVEHLPAGTAVVFLYDGVQIGTGTASALGEAEIELNSKRVATVPTDVMGKAVSVTTAAGAVIVSGSF